MPEANEKRCKVCKVLKPLEMYDKKKTCYDSTCKACRCKQERKARFLKSHKKCPTCGQYKRLDAYYEGSNHISCCKECWKKQKSLMYHSNIDDSRKQSRKYAQGCRDRKFVSELEETIENGATISTVLGLVGRKDFDVMSYLVNREVEV